MNSNYNIIDQFGNFRIVYIGDEKYKIHQFIPSIVEWFELSGFDTKENAINKYLDFILDYYGSTYYNIKKSILRRINNEKY